VPLVSFPASTKLKWTVGLKKMWPMSVAIGDWWSAVSGSLGMARSTNKMHDFFFHTFLLAIGSALCALAVNGILIPHNLLSSGITGVALVLFYKYPVLPVGVLYLLINIPVFFLGWFFISLRFILFTAWGMIIYSLMMYAFPIDFGISDTMLGAIVAGGMTGVGIAIMLRSYGSAGGSEIIVVVLNRLFALTVGTGTLIFNAVLLSFCLLMFPLENVLYTLVFVATSALVTDKVFHGLVTRQAVLIVSSKWHDILNEMTGVNRLGVTLLKGSGAHQKSEITILYSIIKRKDVPSLKSLVMAKDPNAFIAIMDAADVTGRNVGNQPLW